MSPLDLVLSYMEIVFDGTSVGALCPLLAEDCTFEGPFYQFDTAEAYIQSLEAEPPEGFEYRIIQTFERESSVCLVYHFSKPGISVPMAQVFEISEGKISKILLIFDTGAFT